MLCLYFSSGFYVCACLFLQEGGIEPASVVVTASLQSFVSPEKEKYLSFVTCEYNEAYLCKILFKVLLFPSFYCFYQYFGFISIK